MSVSTPLGALRREDDIDPNTRDMVDGIVRELDDTHQGHQGLPGGGYDGMYGNQNQMDYGMPPQSQYGGDMGMGMGGGEMMMAPGDPRAEMMMQQHHAQQHSQPHQQQHINPQAQAQSDKGFIGQLIDYIMNNSREPALAAALYVVMSNDTVSELVSRYIPYAAAPISGLFIRALLVAVLFIVVKMFVFKR